MTEPKYKLLWREKDGSAETFAYGRCDQLPTWQDRIKFLFPHKTLTDEDGKVWHSGFTGWIREDNL